MAEARGVDHFPGGEVDQFPSGARKVDKGAARRGRPRRRRRRPPPIDMAALGCDEFGQPLPGREREVAIVREFFIDRFCGTPWWCLLESYRGRERPDSYLKALREEPLLWAWFAAREAAWAREDTEAFERGVAALPPPIGARLRKLRVKRDEFEMHRQAALFEVLRRYTSTAGLSKATKIAQAVDDSASRSVGGERWRGAARREELRKANASCIEGEHPDPVERILKGEFLALATRCLAEACRDKVDEENSGLIADGIMNRVERAARLGMTEGALRKRERRLLKVALAAAPESVREQLAGYGA